MSQNPHRNQNRMKTTRTKTDATKPSPDFSQPLQHSNPELASLSTNLSSMELNSSIPDELKNQQPLELNQLLKNATSTSEDSAESDKPAKRPDRFTRLEEGLTDQFVMLGMTVSAFHEADGMVIMGRATPLSQKIVALARQNPAVYKALKRYLEGSAYINLVGELATISLAIMANHGLNPVGALMQKLKGKQADGDVELQSVA